MESYVIDLFVLIYIFYRQFQAKEIDIKSKGPYVLLILGSINSYNAIQNRSLTTNSVNIIALTILLIFIAGGGAYLRATYCKVWKENKKFYRQGNWKTLSIWIMMILCHAIIDKVLPSLHFTFMLYIAISLLVQHFILLYRFKHI